MGVGVPRIECDCPTMRLDRILKSRQLVERKPKPEVSLRQVRLNRQRLTIIGGGIVVSAESKETVGEHGVRRSVVQLSRDSTGNKADRTRGVPSLIQDA